MSTTANPSMIVRDILTNPANGVVGIVDNLLVACQEQQLQIDWNCHRCRVKAGNGDWEELPAPLKKSAFRAILARIAERCNAGSSSSVSLYEGQGRLSIGNEGGDQVYFAFKNTAAEQWIEMKTVVADITNRNGKASRGLS